MAWLTGLIAVLSVIAPANASAAAFAAMLFLRAIARRYFRHDAVNTRANRLQRRFANNPFFLHARQRRLLFAHQLFARTFFD